MPAFDTAIEAVGEADRAAMPPRCATLFMGAGVGGALSHPSVWYDISGDDHDAYR
jgi:uncharacterized Zn-finger protein